MEWSSGALNHRRVISRRLARHPTPLTNPSSRLLITVRSGGVLVVGGVVSEAAVEEADEAVGEGSKGVLVGVAVLAALVVEGAGAGAGCDGAEGPSLAGRPVSGVGRSGLERLDDHRFDHVVTDGPAAPGRRASTSPSRCRQRSGAATSTSSPGCSPTGPRSQRGYRSHRRTPTRSGNATPTPATTNAVAPSAAGSPVHHQRG